jgi:hypothetical protein
LKIVTYRNYNPELLSEVNPLEIIGINFNSINTTLESLNALKPDLVPDYIKAIKMRLLEKELHDIYIDIPQFDLQDLSRTCPELSKYEELQELLMKITCKYLDVRSNYQQDDETIKRLEIDIAKAQSVIQFHRAKAFADLLGRKSGIDFWKELVVHMVDKFLKEHPDTFKGSMKEFIDNRLEIASSSEGSNSTVVVYDDYRLLEKIERCMCHESYKHLNDHEFAYLSYCYIGDVADSRCKGLRRIRRRRTQTLYFDDFCDEFFWDDEVFPDAEQPTLEFMRTLVEEDST